MAIRSRGFGTPRFTDRNMAYKFREEIVGKRFLSVSGFTKPKVNKISEWGWRAGVIRAASHRDNGCHDLQVSKPVLPLSFRPPRFSRREELRRLVPDARTHAEVARALRRAAVCVYISERPFVRVYIRSTPTVTPL